MGCGELKYHWLQLGALPGSGLCAAAFRRGEVSGRMPRGLPVVGGFWGGEEKPRRGAGGPKGGRTEAGAGVGDPETSVPAVAALLALSHPQPLAQEKALSPRGRAGRGTVGPRRVLVAGRSDLDGRQLQELLPRQVPT